MALGIEPAAFCLVCRIVLQIVNKCVLCQQPGLTSQETEAINGNKTIVGQKRPIVGQKRPHVETGQQ
jgi:hypothetical protein